jgi:high-affinity nickel-transport protein
VDQQHPLHARRQRPGGDPLSAGETFGMRSLAAVFDDGSDRTRSKIVTIYTLLALANAGAWILAFAAFANRPVLLGTAVLAYTFGLRHSVDADHISAIDNVTRNLMQAGKKPVSVGFFFSLGHSSIVVALSLTVALAARVVQTSLPALQNAGALIGTSVSAFFLYLIAALNAVVLVNVFRTFRRARRGEVYSDVLVDECLNKRGLMGRFFRPLVRSVNASWKMFPIGLLFGLGFDTATEVGLLGIAAIEVGKGMPVAEIMIFPLLFTVGMCLLDTTDGVLMLGCYGWAFVKPLRKLYYNLNVTLVSILVAAFVGTIETLSVLGERFGLSGTFWSGIANASGNFGAIGFGIVGIFVVSWLGSTALYKLRGYDRLGDG